MTNCVSDGARQIHLTNAEKDMAAFDLLPPGVRAAFRDAPISLASEYAVGMPEEDVLAEYDRDFEHFTPLRARPRRNRSFR
jgi:hypothetical protein